MPNGKSTAKGTFVNDSMIKASEWLVRSMQKTHKLIRSFILIYVPLKFGNP